VCVSFFAIIRYNVVQSWSDRSTQLVHCP